MHQGSGDYASSAAPAGHYYPHQYAPPAPNPYPAPTTTATDTPIPGSYTSAPPYSVGGYAEQPPSAPAYEQPPPQYSGYSPYNPRLYPAEPSPAPYYAYQLPNQPTPAAEPNNPPPLPYDVPYYGGGYQPPTTEYGQGGGYQPPTAEYGHNDDYVNDGAYAYSGDGGAEPYGARGTAPTRSGAAMFDDYGRSIGLSSGGQEQPQSVGGGNLSGSFGKIVRAVPKADSHEDSSGGAQKFRVKLLPEGTGSPSDVFCQIGLDGIRMLDHSTSRTLRIYPLDTLTRWEVLDSMVFAFWAKTSMDIQPRRIRLKSNSYTSNTLLDTVTAATVQFKEISEDARVKRTADGGKSSVHLNEKKKGFDWMFAKPVDEVKDHWVPDEAAKKCQSCAADFSHFNRRHHCRNCGAVFCDKCTQGRIALTTEDNAPLVRVCDSCMAEICQRHSMAQDAAKRSSTLQNYGDLAKKLKEELEKKRKSSASASRGASRTRIREVACPTCTVHLQVEVPTSGSETVECGVCQHAFLVNSN